MAALRGIAAVINKTLKMIFMKFSLSAICTFAFFSGLAGNIVQEHMVKTHDGTELYTLTAVAQKNKKYPVIIQRNPYYLNTPKDLAFRKKSLKKRNLEGFAYVIQHCQGTGKSGGDFIPYVNEAADGMDLLEWVRKQDFYNGEIYISGGSYSSTVHGAYLNTPQPDIKGIYWAVQDTERYNIIYRNGFLRLQLHSSWYLKMYKKNSAIQRKQRMAKFNSFPLKGLTRRVFGTLAEDYETILLHPDQKDPFWKTPGYGGGEYANALVNAKIPTFFIGAWHDIYITGMIDIWRKLAPAHRNQCVFMITPFEHSYLKRRKNLAPELFSPGGCPSEYAGIESQDVYWFKHLREGTPLNHFTKGQITRYVLFGDRWETSADIGSNSRYCKFYLAENRELTATPPQTGKITYTYDPRNPATFKGACHGNFGGVELQDAPNSRQDIISFISEPFEEDKTVEGDFYGKLFVTSTAPDTCFYLRLSIVKNDRAFGLRNEIDSICRTNQNFAPGKEAVIGFKIAAHSFKVAKGERLRLDVSSSCWPYFQLHSNFRGNQALQRRTQIAKNTIVTGKSFIAIPFSASR